MREEVAVLQATPVGDGDRRRIDDRRRCGGCSGDPEARGSMLSIRKSLTDPDQGPAIQAAVKALGFAPLVDHFLLHAALYAKKLGLAGEIVDSGNEPRDPSDVWHDLYVKFAIDVSSAYRADPAKQKTLLGSYDSQLAEYRVDQAKARKRAAKKSEAEAPKAKAEGEGPKTAP
ncbi:MAG: hypothetical protein ACMG6S_21675 [Byssovorax sp.]